MNVGKILILFGFILIGMGFFVTFMSKSGFHIPGDIVVKKDNFTLIIPIGTSVLLSVLLTLIFWVISKF